MTGNKITQKLNIGREKIQQASKKTIGTVAPVVSKWWSFMKEKIGPTWSFLIIVLGLFLILTVHVSAGLLYIFLIGPISILTVKYARPDVIVTTGSVLTAKLGWAVGFPICALLFSFYLTGTIIKEKEDVKNIQPNYEFACSEEGIKKSGKAGCQRAKEKYVSYLKKELEPIQIKYKEENRLINQYTKEKNQKCTEEGIIEYGSDGCSAATNNLERHIKWRDEYQQKAELLEEKINELKK